jgi:hypothetical protein
MKFQYVVQNIENYDTLDADEKEKTTCKGTAEKKSQKISFDFSKSVIFGSGSGSGSAS